MAENFPQMAKDTNLQIQETEWIPNRITKQIQTKITLFSLDRNRIETIINLWMSKEVQN